MKQKMFKLFLKEQGFEFLRNNGKHEIYSKNKERFAIPRGGNTISQGIIWNFSRKYIK